MWVDSFVYPVGGQYVCASVCLHYIARYSTIMVN